MLFDGKANWKGEGPAGRMAGVALIGGLQEYNVQHAEFRDLAADSVDFHPVTETNAVAPHQHKPSEESDDEVLESNRQAGADDTARRRKLTRHAHHDQQNDQDGDDAQAHARDAAQRFNLSPIQFWAVEQMLHPTV